ncbi:hypothetical protein AFFFEF_00921 [Methylorubrum extorquens]
MPQATLHRQLVGQTLHHEHEKQRRTGLSELVLGVYSRIPPTIALPLTPASRPRHSCPLRTALQLSGSPVRLAAAELRLSPDRLYPVYLHTQAALRCARRTLGQQDATPDLLTRSQSRKAQTTAFVL